MSSAVTSATDRPIERIGNDPSLIQGVTIRECGEPVVEVPEGDSIFVAPAYRARDVPSAPDRVVVREGVLAGLRRAAAALPEGYGLLLWDGLRTLETQTAIVETFRASLPDGHGDEMVDKYLARPPASEAEFLEDPPPHATGGAIDLTLCDSSGRPQDMGADFDEFEETAWLRHFEEGGDDNPRAHEYRERRRLLYWAMIAAGFAPYPWEYWHYEVGTMVAAVFHGLPFARYGAAVPWVGPT